MAILETKSVGVYACSLPEAPRFFLLDTPGFDDSQVSDYDVLREVSIFLASSYSSSVKLSGIVYLHRISDVRFNGASGRNIRVFRRLCGTDNLDSVVLATNFWDTVDPDVGKMRELDLNTRNDQWQFMIEHGCSTFRQDSGKQSGAAILLHLISRKQRTVLQIQHELVDQDKNLGDTQAAEALSEEVLVLKRDHEAELMKVQEQYQKALREQDARHQIELERIKKEHEDYIQKLLKSIAVMTLDKDRGFSGGNEYASSNISGQARVVLGNQSFHIQHATFTYSDEPTERRSKRPRQDTLDETGDVNPK